MFSVNFLIFSPIPHFYWLQAPSVPSVSTFTLKEPSLFLLKVKTSLYPWFPIFVSLQGLLAVPISFFFIIIPSLKGFSQQHVTTLFISYLCFKLSLYLYLLPFQIPIFGFSFTIALLRKLSSFTLLIFPPFKISNIIQVFK